MTGWNTTNTSIYYFQKDGKKFTYFSLWVSLAGVVVKAPNAYARFLDQHIDTVISTLQNEGWSAEKIT